MSPFEEYRKYYITVCFAVAGISAFVLGVNQPVSFRIVNGLIFGGILYVTGFVLWNTFRFAIPANTKYKLIFLFVLAILTGLIITGAESFAMYLCFPTLFGSFSYSIPVRLFITLLLFVIIRLIYTSCYRKNESQVFEQQEIPLASSSINRVTVRNGQKINIIPIEEIIFIKADGDYISINTANGSWLKEQTMKDIENILPVDSFVRIHRSYIVNVNYISRIERYGEYRQVILNNNSRIKISAARYQALKQILGI